MNSDLTTVLILLVFGGIFSLIGLGLLLFNRYQTARVRQAQKWPSLPGTIVSSRLESHTSTEYDDGRSYTRTTHTPLVEYTYELFGRSYRGDRIFPGAAMSFDLGAAQAIIDRYPVGQQVSVYYDPADPAQAVLEARAAGGKVLLIIGSLFAAVGILGCCAAGAFGLLR